MSADSLNASSPKNLPENDIQSPIDDRTYTKHEDEKESNCERLSQVSPFLLSPTTDSSAPDPSDNVAGVSTVSKATVPTDAKSSKPSETQCLSKATSIDSWCSNDTLYNVEENFDDLAMDPDVPLDFEAEPVVDKSESEDTLTYNEDEKEASHCSTYIIHDSKSEACDTFSKDSINAKDNHTYTKIKTEDTAATITKSDINDCTKNTSIVDLVFGTPVCVMQSYANCTYELGSGLDYAWNLPQPEMVRRSPIDDKVNFTPPRDISEKGDTTAEESPQMPQLTMKPCVKKMESVELSCLESPVQLNNSDSTDEKVHNVEVNSTKTQGRDMLQSITSTPIVTVQDDENIEPFPLRLPGVNTDECEHFSGNAPNLQSFFASAENRTQDISSNVTIEPVSSILFEGESKTLSKDSNTKRSSTEMSPINNKVPDGNKHIVTEPAGYSDFENSANTKLQDDFMVRPIRNLESSENSEDFRRFESSILKCPQDLSSFIDASSCLIKNERIHSDLANKIITSSDSNTATQSCAEVESESQVSVSSNFTNLFESREIDNNSERLNVFITDLDIEEETEQPHSIIITQSPLIASKVSPNVACDSNTRTNCTDVNYTYNSHTSANYPVKDVWQKDTNKSDQKDLNDITENLLDVNVTSKDSNLVNPTSPLLAIEESSVGSHSTSNKEIESNTQVKETETNALVSDKKSPEASTSSKCNGGNEMYATVNFLNETFEELLESNVDDNDVGNSDLNKEDQTVSEKSLEIVTDSESTRSPATFDILEGPTLTMEQLYEDRLDENGIVKEEKQVASVTEDFLQNEKKYCQLDSFFPLLSDIRFTGK